MTVLLERLHGLLREGTLPILLPLFFLALTMSVLVVERSLYLFGGPWFLLGWWPPSRRRCARLRQRVDRAFDDYEEAPTAASRRGLLLACRGWATPYTSFIRRALEDRDLARSRPSDLKLAEAALREEMGIERGLPMLATLAKAAPLIGLLGTVIGMIQTFRVMMLASTSDPRALSSGISIALIATEVGLLVALPGVIASSWLRRRAQTLSEEIRLASMRLRQVRPESRQGAYR